jgi:uncharacterized protein YkwD
MTAFARLAAVALAACAIVPAAANDASRTDLESEVLARINQARQDPRGYADELRAYRRYFDGRIAHLPGEDVAMLSIEGTDAIDEAIDFLERQAPLPPLGAGDLLALAARDHANEQGDSGTTGHVSRDGAGPGDRVRRRGGDLYVGESISYGHARADAVVRQMIVDDGVPGRGHRALLFGTGYRFAGIGCGGHRRYGHMCVVELSGTIDGAPVLPEWARAKGARLVRTREVARR